MIPTLPVMFEFVDLEIGLQGIDLTGHSREASRDFSAEGFLRFSDPAVTVDQHRERDDHGEGKGHHLRVGHLKLSLPHSSWVPQCRKERLPPRRPEPRPLS